MAALFNIFIIGNLLALALMQSSKIESYAAQAKEKYCALFQNFKGSSCREKPSIADSRKLFTYNPIPLGIGMSFDIAWGNIKIPAFEFTFDEKNGEIQKDKNSGNQYLIPQEAKIQFPDVSEGKASAQIFKNENELADVWAESKHHGVWHGGILSEPKKVKELYDQIFSNGRSTGIIQEPKISYAMAFKHDQFILNEFSNAALNYLPSHYSTSEYSDFLDSFGTHIITDSYLGGLIEQQSIFKECIWTNPAMKGISLSTLLYYLKFP